MFFFSGNTFYSREKFLAIIIIIIIIIITKEVNAAAPGYIVNGDTISTKSGFQIPLTVKPGPTDFYGKTIKDLVVQVDYETVDRLHVKVSSC